jgi:hypothetical protein
MFCIVKQQREVKFLLVYAGMLEHMKMPTTYFKQVSKIGGGCPPPQLLCHWTCTVSKSAQSLQTTNLMAYVRNR